MYAASFDAQIVFIFTILVCVTIYYFVFDIFPKIKQRYDIWRESRTTLEVLKRKECVIAKQEIDLMMQLEDEIKLSRKSKHIAESNSLSTKQPFVLKIPESNQLVVDREVNNHVVETPEIVETPYTRVERKNPSKGRKNAIISRTGINSHPPSNPVDFHHSVDSVRDENDRIRKIQELEYAESERKDRERLHELEIAKAEKEEKEKVYFQISYFYIFHNTRITITLQALELKIQQDMVLREELSHRLRRYNSIPNVSMYVRVYVYF